MKPKIIYRLKKFAMVIPMTLMATFCITGCTLWAHFMFSGGSTPKALKDPLAGWTFKPFPRIQFPPDKYNTNHLETV
jgi:hypothetical protein